MATTPLRALFGIALGSLLVPAGPLPAQIEFEMTTHDVGLCPAQIEAVDPDGDGDLDLVFSNHHTHDLRILVG